jgi:putative ABC transport system ATP-binding protein
MIKAKSIIKTYHDGTIDTEVLKGVDFALKTGDFVSLTGKSGAGKSTLLYQLGLLDRPDTGSVEIDGILVTDLDDKKQTQFRLENLGYIFQDYALIPDLTAVENIMVPLLMLGIETQTARKMACETLEQVGLKGKENNLPNALSGGEQQRVSVARAICNKPKILFADEPTANLDTANSKNILELFKDLNKKGQTILMVTHEREYTKYGNRVFNMIDGVIEEL